MPIATAVHVYPLYVTSCSYSAMYRKQQILRGTKLSRLTGFLAECRENCHAFVKLQYII